MEQYVLIEKYKEKKCSKCGEIKSANLEHFNKCNKVKAKLTAKCKKCLKFHYDNNREEILLAHKKYYQSNKTERQKKQREYNKNNKLKKQESGKKYRNKNKKLIQLKKAIYDNKKRKEDSLYKLKGNIRNLIRIFFRKHTIKKNSKTHQILGCTFEEFKIHIEKQFLPWMNWNNYGKYNGEFEFGWDLDHIIPINSALTEEDIIKLNHYSNFQPLCSHINRDIKIGRLSYVL